MELGRGQLKHEIISESLEVTLDRLDEGSGFHVVKIRKIVAQQDLISSDQVDLFPDRIDWNDELVCHR